MDKSFTIRGRYAGNITECGDKRYAYAFDGKLVGDYHMIDDVTKDARGAYYCDGDATVGLISEYFNNYSGYK